MQKKRHHNSTFYMMGIAKPHICWDMGGNCFCKIFDIIIMLQLKSKYSIEGLLPYGTEVLVIQASGAFLCQDEMDRPRIRLSAPGHIEICYSWPFHPWVNALLDDPTSLAAF